MILRFIFISSILATNLFAELYWSGKANIPYNFYLKNFKNTENPIRFMKLNINYGLENIEFRSNTAFEYKWNGDIQNSINLREYYLSYYPSFGEINIGKQIITWGFADGNNPTNNINPYDLNYMFTQGVDRKLGVHSISSIIYYNDLKMNLVLSYDNIQNIKNERLPLPLPENDNKNKFEYGIDIQYNINQAEFNLSYLMKKNIPIMLGVDSTSQTNVHTMGINLLYLYDEITLRNENAIFFGENNERFYQGVIQLDFPSIFEFIIGAQIFGTSNINNSASGIYAIGSPIFLLTETSPLFTGSLSRSFNDDTIDLNIFTMFEILGGYGSSLGLEINYNISDNLKTSINFSNFLKGNNKSAFNNLRDYSNIKIDIEYFF